MALSQFRLSADSAVSFYTSGLSSRPHSGALSGDMLVEWPLPEPMATHFWRTHCRVDSIEKMYGRSQYDGYPGLPMVTSRSTYWAVVGRHHWFG